MAPARYDLRINLNRGSSLTADFSLLWISKNCFALSFLNPRCVLLLFQDSILDVAVAQTQQEHAHEALGVGGLSASFQYCDVRATAAH